MAALGWLLNLGFAGGGFPVDSRETVIAGADRVCTPATSTRSCGVGASSDMTVGSSNRTFVIPPADG